MKHIFTNRWTHILVLLAVLSGALLVRMHDYRWAQSLRFLAFDFYNKIDPRAPTEEAVIVDIDEASLGHEDLGQWPWSRLAIATLVENLNAMGAKAVVFDMVFAEADRTSPQSVSRRMPATPDYDPVRSAMQTLPDNDELLARTIRAAGNVVTAFIWSSSKEATRQAPTLSQPVLISKTAQPLTHDIPAMTGVATSLPVLSEAAAGNGSFGVTPEVDGIIRRVPLLFSFRDEADPDKIMVYPSLAIEALRVAQGPKTVTKIRTLKPEEAGPFDPPLLMNIGAYTVPMDWDGQFLVHFSPERHQNYIPAWTVIDGTADPAKIKDKIVFVGTSAEGLKDLRSTPLDLFIPGVEVHVNVVEQILSGDTLLRPRILDGVELLSTGVIGLLIIVLSPFIGAVFMAGFTLLLVCAIGLASWYGYDEAGLLLDPVYPSICLIMMYIMSSVLSYMRTETERKQVRQAFGLYISPHFMEELANNPEKLRLGGETRELTVMFTDIRGFTGIAENMTPEQLIHLMNEFLTPMSDLVMENRGTIDKYMGDAMMSFWNAPLDVPDHARHACLAALQMNSALQPINEKLLARAKAEGRKQALLKAGIGLNTGTASVGNMGSKQRFAYSAIGDTVNLASRLEGQTKTYAVSIIIGEETQSRIPDFATLELDILRVKGKQEPARIYALMGDAAYAAQPFFAPLRAAHGEMLAAYRAQDFDRAAKRVQECRDLAQDRLQDYYNIYMARIAALKENPPDKGWDGVYTATEK